MKTILIFIILSISSCGVVAQYDTVISNDIYTSYYSFKLHDPVYVSYKLYKGGGNYSRNGMNFHTDKVKNTATNKDYSHSGYDKGHLADAKDFAYDSIKEEETFRFYNCVPQTPELNRGIWEQAEYQIRKISQSDSLFIIAGSIFGTEKLPHSQVAIPTSCFKVVQSLKTKEILYCFFMTNNEESKVINLALEELEKKLNYKLPIK
jgi:endonuclease G